MLAMEITNCGCGGDVIRLPMETNGCRCGGTIVREVCKVEAVVVDVCNDCGLEIG